MSSHGNTLPQGKRMSFGHPGVTNASLLIEKQKATLRRATPDSEALASSDDEQDTQIRSLYTNTSQSMRPTRRSSWISETVPSLNRKSSIGTSDSQSPGSLLNHPGTPDVGSWSSASVPQNRNHSQSASLPWNNSIWNSDSPKGIPPRLIEVLSSPTDYGAHSGFNEEVLQSPSRRDSSSDTSIPFAIPLHPTLKSYRSQSYSVGQLDQELSGSSQFRSQHSYGGRVRAGSSYAGLQHRPSRPSVLGEFSADTAPLGQLREVDDDERSSTSSDANVRFSNMQGRKMEQIAIENALLRQRSQLNHGYPTSHSNAHFASKPMLAPRVPSRGLHVSESVLEEPGDEHEIENDAFLAQPLVPKKTINDKRLNEHSVSTTNSLLSKAVDQKSFTNGKKGHWQSSLGFGSSTEYSQSRRHSFADVPLRSSPGNGLDDNKVTVADTVTQYPYGETTRESLRPEDGSARITPMRIPEAPRHPQVIVASQNPLSSSSQNRITHFASSTPHGSQSLYLVTFKACRAEFYYVQDGTGLDVNPGDLVIVEADRGTDLGKVVHKNVEWASARELKEHYVAEHYNWLMMFSRHGQGGQGQVPHGWSPGAHTERTLQNSAALQGLTHSIDIANADIKPKMIKRLAQPHEIHTLREKEGNEAKAMRMCQQKVTEHHLNMEILDAEFQMDWKKLTFYYFADSYINFNSLVTDLFKIYKTRIWMSAINPASFVSPATSLQLPSTNSITGIKSDRFRPVDQRLRHENELSLSSVSTGTAFDTTWYPLGEQGSSHSHNQYGHYWSAQAFQQPAQPSVDIALTHSTVSPFQNLNISAPPLFPVGVPPRMQSKSEGSVSARDEQLQRLHSLTLGPT